jgi:hypothetical protein
LANSPELGAAEAVGETAVLDDSPGEDLERPLAGRDEGGSDVLDGRRFDIRNVERNVSVGLDIGSVVGVGAGGIENIGVVCGAAGVVDGLGAGMVAIELDLWVSVTLFVEAAGIEKGKLLPGGIELKDKAKGVESDELLSREITPDGVLCISKYSPGDPGSGRSSIPGIGSGSEVA